MKSFNNITLYTTIIILVITWNRTKIQLLIKGQWKKEISLRNLISYHEKNVTVLLLKQGISSFNFTSAIFLLTWQPTNQLRCIKWITLLHSYFDILSMPSMCCYSIETSRTLLRNVIHMTIKSRTKKKKIFMVWKPWSTHVILWIPAFMGSKSKDFLQTLERTISKYISLGGHAYIVRDPLKNVHHVIIQEESKMKTGNTGT